MRVLAAFEPPEGGTFKMRPFVKRRAIRCVDQPSQLRLKGYPQRAYGTTRRGAFNLRTFSSSHRGQTQAVEGQPGEMDFALAGGSAEA